MLTRREFLKDAALLGAAGISLPLISCGSSGDNYDIIIRNGTVYNGTTAGPFVADVAIRSDRIVAIGHLSGSARKTIDARGCIVAPGFIDVHDHTDSIFQQVGSLKDDVKNYPTWMSNEAALRQGVTTVISGNCGYGYSDMNGYYTFLDDLPFGSNTYYLTAHGQIRQDLFGESQPTMLTATELQQLKAKVAEEMEKGALGMSTGLGYVPGSYAQKAELIELGRVLRRYNGIYVTHIRNDLPPDLTKACAQIMEGILEAIDIGRRAGVPVQISHIKGYLGGAPADYNQICLAIENARAEGIDVTADQYPFTAASTVITVLVPPKYRTATALQKDYWWMPIIKDEVNETFRTLQPNMILVPDWKTYEYKRLDEIAAAEGKSAADIYLEMVSTDSPPSGLYFFIDQGAMEMLMPKEYVFTGSDGAAVPDQTNISHPRFTATFALKLKEYALRRGLLTLQNAILSMTARPAEKFRLAGRGKILPDYYADVCVIDPATLSAPASYTQPHLYSTGVTHVIVNGILEMDNGTSTGQRGGRTLRRWS